MRLLVVFCHPCEESFCGAIYRHAVETLERCGHELRCHDLYREGFQPIMTTEERRGYMTSVDGLIERNAQHIEDLRWAQGLIVIHPTWYYGPPAMLKGWLECVWLPGVTFEVSPQSGALAKPLLTNINLFVGITTSGSPWWWIKLIRDPCRSLWTRGLRPIFGRRCRMIWRQLYDMNHTTETSRTAFLKRIETTLEKL